ncbi:hypothetical protein D3P08_17240 [Paenibacillus nanensis]|uniref:Uncharacterized protein n=1 Tax=Paenibacillus nanensis TaxID=393251 RepID=A0A3A1UTS5_9BACL|nr:hypothetical protein D3P08_17240 [Paenibacillus nanensis]
MQVGLLDSLQMLQICSIFIAARSFSVKFLQICIIFFEMWSCWGTEAKKAAESQQFYLKEGTN